MTRAVTTVLFVALLGVAGSGGPRPALAAGYDGNWSVLIITEKGDCDAAYRYAVGVAKGQIRYLGEAAVSMSGTVTPAGAVKVSIKLGDKSANGTGRLSAGSGTGAGRWEAERR